MLEAAIVRVPSNRIYDPEGQFPILMRTTSSVANEFDFIKYCSILEMETGSLNPCPSSLTFLPGDFAKLLTS